ncbi:MAG: hypothetical protein JXR37_07885 [Kiritimatiellae bacterium]|nr:hypothetical protein [Kiritimatiellia bacterium]
MRRHLHLGSLLIWALVSAVPRAGHAYNERVRVADVDVMVFAPDWIWQARDANVMVVAQNTGTEEAGIELSASCADEARPLFGLAQDKTATGKAPAGDKVRMALTGITPGADTPPAVYPFAIRIRVAGHEQKLDWPLKVIRGSLVEAGTWSLLLPALVCLLWSVALVAVLPRFAARGAWRTPGPPFDESTEEGWFKGGG